MAGRGNEHLGGTPCPRWRRRSRVKAVPETGELCTCSSLVGKTARDQWLAAARTLLLSLTAREFLFTSEVLRVLSRRAMDSEWFISGALVCVCAYVWRSRCVSVEHLLCAGSASHPDRKSTRLNSSHVRKSRMPSSA